ncbi:MAG: hypothetical protein KBC74_01225 [Candidatus Pacebacteria bacterium]|nr:hypothetical protein [Candidatus Paceibacterota bacterium]
MNEALENDRGIDLAGATRQALGTLTPRDRSPGTFFEGAVREAARIIFSSGK